MYIYTIKALPNKQCELLSISVLLQALRYKMRDIWSEVVVQVVFEISEVMAVLG